MKEKAQLDVTNAYTSKLAVALFCIVIILCLFVILTVCLFGSLFVVPSKGGGMVAVVGMKTATRVDLAPPTWPECQFREGALYLQLCALQHLTVLCAHFTYQLC